MRYARERYTEGMQRIDMGCVFDVVDRDGEQHVIVLRTDEIEVGAADALISYNHDLPPARDVELNEEVDER
ncbi:hypothetical protein [Natrinema salsiterrestre]|uniref:Uncharacterized protein n=1 Tax=Natrinema salsiterrestre TaxID=2950540 RepID=A0A9Q4L4U1_9EURY|nr:hypothetical protein [Natrinema salsiterrestre]MDF9747609.1 hypothetical protein [Natrinema salsiterrestre]